MTAKYDNQDGRLRGRALQLKPVLWKMGGKWNCFDFTGCALAGCGRGATPKAAYDD